MYCIACKCFSVLGINLLYSSWEYRITVACYKGSGCCWPGCKAGGSIHSAMHSLSQARGSRGRVLDSALPSKVWYGPPPQGCLKCGSCVLLCMLSPRSPLLLWGCCEVEQTQAYQVGRDVSPWSTLGSRCKQQPCSLPEGQIILSVSCSRGTPRLESWGFFYLLFGFDISLEL